MFYKWVVEILREKTMNPTLVGLHGSQLLSFISWKGMERGCKPPTNHILQGSLNHHLSREARLPSWWGSVAYTHSDEMTILMFPRTIGRNLPRTGEKLWRWMRLVVWFFWLQCYVFGTCFATSEMCSLSLCLWVYMNRCIYTKVLGSYKDGWRCAEICLHLHECLDTLQPCCQMIRKLPRSVNCLGMRWCHANGRLPKWTWICPGWFGSLSALKLEVDIRPAMVQVPTRWASPSIKLLRTHASDVRPFSILKRLNTIPLHPFSN
jgi:hypothetical protein